jgi:hypothetical protein
MEFLNNLIRYFDLQSDARAKRSANPSLYSGAPNLPVLPQYLAMAAGILVQPFLARYQATGAWDIGLASFFGRAAFAAIVGFLVFPAVYKKTLDADQPLFLQFCLIFASGVGWKALLGTAEKAVLG